MTIENNRSRHNGSPCAIPPFCRNNYFTGKLLTERDFTAEQQYTMDTLRLHHVALHGWGVVCGLKVTPHPQHPASRLVVEPGLAVDGCGRQSRVPEAIERELPSVTPWPGPADDSLGSGSGCDEYDRDPDASAEGQASPGGPTVDLYVCLRYAEREAELALHVGVQGAHAGLQHVLLVVHGDHDLDAGGGDLVRGTPRCPDRGAAADLRGAAASECRAPAAPRRSPMPPKV